MYDYVRTNAVKTEVATDYRLRNFKLSSSYSFEDMLKMNDEQLLEVATDTRKASPSYYGDKEPLIKIKKKTFDILLLFGSEEKYYSVASVDNPDSFYDLSVTTKEVLDHISDTWTKEDLLDDLLKVSVSELRTNIEKVVESLNAKKED